MVFPVYFSAVSGFGHHEHERIVRGKQDGYHHSSHHRHPPHKLTQFSEDENAAELKEEETLKSLTGSKNLTRVELMVSPPCSIR